MAGSSSAAAARTGNNPFLRAVAFLSLLSGWTAAAMIVASVVITCQMIFVRFVLNQSTIWQTEAVVYLMVAATMLGLPYVQYLRGHVNVDLIPMALPMPLRRVLFYLTMSTAIAIICVMAFYSFEYWHIAWERNWRSDTVWGVRLWIPYLALPIGFALFVLQLLADMVAVAIGVDTPFGLEDS
jgi:TRAP-type C4-dicarboxylate transport system permease small subunit